MTFMELNGRLALVIGAGSGVGRGVAQALSHAGMQVTAADIDGDSVQKTCEGLPGARAFQVDATEQNSLQNLASAAFPAGHLDLLVVTVGVIDQLPIAEISEAQWQWAWNLNVMTSVRAVQVFLPLLRRGKPSAIVLTGSGAGLPLLERDPDSALYIATKHAQMGYGSVLRDALAPEGIRVVMLLPSGVEGNLAVTSAKSRAVHMGMNPTEVRGQQPAGRKLISPVEMGKLLVRGLQADASYVNNRGADFHEAMTEWLEKWKKDTVEA